MQQPSRPPNISGVAMAPSDDKALPAAAANGDPPARVGPHPGFITSSNQYSSEIKIRRMLRDNGCDPAREDNYRLQGVQLIDNVREHIQLYVMLSQEHLLGLLELTGHLQAGADLRHGVHVLPQIPTQLSRFRVQLPGCGPGVAVCGVQG